MPKPNIVPPPSHIIDVSTYDWKRWFNDLETRLGNVPFSIPGFAVADLPDAENHGSVSTTSPYASLLFVPDATGGAALAFSNGTDWISTITGVAV